MESSLFSSFATAGLTLFAYAAVPILFAVLYPNRLGALFCWISGSVHGGLVFLFFSFFGFPSLATLLLAIGQALIWTAAGTFIMSIIGRSKPERTGAFACSEKRWYKSDKAVRIMTAVLLFCEFSIYAVLILQSVK